MTTMNVLDSAGSTVAVEKPLTPGQAAMAASRPVVIASDQSAVPVSLASVPSHAVTNSGTFAVQNTAATPAGSAVIGKVSVDQTTPGTTDSVTVATGQGAGATIGATADAVVAAGAAGSLSAKLRAISRDLVANIVLAAGSAVIGKVSVDQTTPGTTDSVTVSTAQGAGAAIGAVSGAAVTTDVNGTIQQYLRGLVKQWAAGALGVVLGAETTKVIGVVRNADGSGTLLTSTAGAIDVNIKSGTNTNGQAVMASSAPVALATDQKYQTGMSPRAFSVAFSTLTRPANVTAYSALDSISDNATAGSVTALTATVSDTNSDPLTITEILISSTDTGLAGKKIRAYLFNSDPTASTGVGAGDNVAYSQKKAGYIGSMSGVLETGFSDGTVGRLVPSFADGSASPLSNAGANGFIVTAPSAAGKALWIQYQAIDAFTPSANSTTIIGTVRGFQGRAA